MVKVIFESKEDNILKVKLSGETFEYDVLNQTINASDLIKQLGELTEKVNLDTKEIQMLLESKKRSEEFIIVYKYIKKIIELYNEAHTEAHNQDEIQEDLNQTDDIEELPF